MWERLHSARLKPRRGLRRGGGAWGRGGTRGGEDVAGGVRRRRREAGRVAASGTGEVGAGEWEGMGLDLLGHLGDSRMSGATCRRPMCTGGWGAILERGGVQTGGSLSGARKKG
jgi:hypothetical protein